MKVTNDPGVDVLRILLSNGAIEESDEEKPGVIVDYDKDGNVVGLEILARPSEWKTLDRLSTRSRAYGAKAKAARRQRPLPHRHPTQPAAGVHQRRPVRVPVHPHRQLDAAADDQGSDRAL
jgi:uncharacterized protein YuzE